MTATARRLLRHMELHGGLDPLPGGMGGAYLLLDQNEEKAYLLKPSDEDILALNNRKHNASPFDGKKTRERVRGGIPLYLTVQTEVLA